MTWVSRTSGRKARRNNNWAAMLAEANIRALKDRLVVVARGKYHRAVYGDNATRTTAEAD